MIGPLIGYEVLTYKYTWQQGLAAVFCSGVIFFLISVFFVHRSFYGMRIGAAAH